MGEAGGGRASTHGWNSSDAGTGTVEGASPGPLAHLKLSITKSKWKETRGWAVVRATHKIKKLPEGTTEAGLHS